MEHQKSVFLLKEHQTTTLPSLGTPQINISYPKATTIKIFCPQSTNRLTKHQARWPCDSTHAPPHRREALHVHGAAQLRQSLHGQQQPDDAHVHPHRREALQVQRAELRQSLRPEPPTGEVQAHPRRKVAYRWHSRYIID